MEMGKFIRQYTVAEFESEFGQILPHTLQDGIVLTENNTKLRLSLHLKDAIDKGLIRWDRNQIKNYVTNLFESDDLEDESYTLKKREWVLFASDLEYSRTNNKRYILFHKYNYKTISQRNNFCDFFIEIGNENGDQFIYIDDKTHIYEFINDKSNKSYELVTDKGIFHGKYTTESFIGAFIKLMDYPTTSNDLQCYHFFLYMDGTFAKSKKKVITIV